MAEPQEISHIWKAQQDFFHMRTATMDSISQTPKTRYWLDLIALLLIVTSSVLTDQSSKMLVETHLKKWESQENLKVYLGDRIPLAMIGQDEPESSFFLSLAFNYVRNQGAAWGFLSDLEDHIREPFFYLVTLFASLVILFYFRSTPAFFRTPRFALALIFSGAIGNFLDRVRLGYVVDFIEVRWNLPIPFSSSTWSYIFPSFNWADSMITVGVSILLFDMLFLEKKRDALYRKSSVG
jgi:signal peptidase II